MALEEVLRTRVAAFVRENLAAAPVSERYVGVLTSALSQHGNILSGAPDFRWAQPVYVCCVAAGGSADQALPPAAAVEIAMVALDLLDDLEDGDSNPLIAEFGAPIALNATTGLLFAAQSILLESPAGAAMAGSWLADGLKSGSGQHADLTYTATMGLPYEDLLEITSAKSGSLMAGVCRLGALAAGADLLRLDLFSTFGRLLGVAAQVANDIRGAGLLGQRKTDIQLSRPTLPLAYAARAVATAGSPAQSCVAVAAMHFAWTVAESYRHRALQIVPLLTEDVSSRASLEGLLHVF